MSHDAMDTLSDLLPLMQAAGEARTFSSGELLVEQGRHDQQVYYLMEGAVDIVRDGRMVGRVESGDLVGEYAFLDNRPRTASVIAVEEVVAVELDRQALFNSAGSDLVTLTKFLQVATERMERRLQYASKENDDEFLARLTAEALSHRAINHPYLIALSSGDLPDPHWALMDFGLQYYGYSAHFPRYLTQTISQLSAPGHRNGLLQNLTEECGEYDDQELEELNAAGIPSDWIVGVPHPVLFKRFCDAMEVRLGGVEEDAMEVICWREMFLDVLGGGSPAQAIGALGLGTENIVSTMYQNFLPALECIDMEPRDAVFFPLHALVDDHHQAVLLDIARDFAGSEEGRRELTKGMRKALYLRAGFWDWLYSRALDPEEVDRSAG